MSYTNEYQTALRHIEERNAYMQNLSYFLDTAVRWHAFFEDGATIEGQPGTPNPVVVVLGYGIPEQLIYACHTTPLYLLGGSHESCAWSDDAVPRDSDPASRSILGYALRICRRTDVDPLFVVPMVNDNMRKVAYLLAREGHAVLSVDILPEVVDVTERRAWERSLQTMVHGVAKHVGRRASARSIRAAERLVSEARAAMLDFERAAATCEGVLSGEAALLVLSTYYMTGDLAQWSAILRRLTVETRARCQGSNRLGVDAPRVLAIGSPLLFPQYKVPNLIHDAGMSLVASVDAASTSRYASLSAQELRGGFSSLIGTIARRHYTLDSSSAHVVNGAMEQYVEHLISAMEVDGVICHILKGQIEYDFLLARLEPLFNKYDIPVFRLETDYQYQDVEQLRIRLEAFAEMLEQRSIALSQQRVRRSA